MTNESTLDLAFEIISAWKNKSDDIKTGYPFADLWKEVTAKKGYTEEEAGQWIGSFYTDLSLDGRFVALTDNTWDLRSRHKYEQVHIDVQDVYSDVDEGDPDAEDLEDEKEYNAAAEGKSLPEEESEPSEEAKPDDDAAALVGIKKEESSY